MEPMTRKYTLTDIRIYPGQSEETTAFNGKVRLDGKVVGFASNRGHGDSNLFTPECGTFDRRAFADWCREAMRGHPTLGEFCDSKHSSPIDLWLSGEVDREEKRRWEARKAKRKILLQKPEDIGTTTYLTLPGPYRPDLAPKLREIYGKDIRIVNEELAVAIVEEIPIEDGVTNEELERRGY